MTARSWFGVAVRCAGLVCFFHALAYFLYFLDMRLGLSTYSDANTPSVPTGYITYVAAYAVAGILTLRSADWIVAFTYDAGPNEPNAD